MISSKPRLVVPYGLKTLLEGVSRAILKTSPGNITQFAALYFKELILFREANSSLDIKDLVKQFHHTKVEQWSEGTEQKKPESVKETESSDVIYEEPKRQEPPKRQEKSTDTEEDNFEGPLFSNKTTQFPSVHTEITEPEEITESVSEPTPKASTPKASTPPSSPSPLAAVSPEFAYYSADPAQLAVQMLGNVSSVQSEVLMVDVATSIPSFPDLYVFPGASEDNSLVCSSNVSSQLQSQIELGSKDAKAETPYASSVPLQDEQDLPAHDQTPVPFQADIVVTSCIQYSEIDEPETEGETISELMLAPFRPEPESQTQVAHTRTSLVSAKSQPSGKSVVTAKLIATPTKSLAYAKSVASSKRQTAVSSAKSSLKAEASAKSLPAKDSEESLQEEPSAESLQPEASSEYLEPEPSAESLQPEASAEEEASEEEEAFAESLYEEGSTQCVQQVVASVKSVRTQGSVKSGRTPQGSIKSGRSLEGSVKSMRTVSQRTPEGSVKSVRTSEGSAKSQRTPEGSAKSQRTSQGSVKSVHTPLGSAKSLRTPLGSAKCQRTPEGSLKCQRTPEGSLKCQRTSEGSAKPVRTPEGSAKPVRTSEGSVKSVRTPGGSAKNLHAEGSVKSGRTSEGSAKSFHAEGSAKSVHNEGSKKSVAAEGSTKSIHSKVNSASLEQNPKSIHPVLSVKSATSGASQVPDEPEYEPEYDPEWEFEREELPEEGLVPTAIAASEAGQPPPYSNMWTLYCLTDMNQQSRPSPPPAPPPGPFSQATLYLSNAKDPQFLQHPPKVTSPTYVMMDDSKRTGAPPFILVGSNVQETQEWKPLPGHAVISQPDPSKRYTAVQVPIAVSAEQQKFQKHTPAPPNGSSPPNGQDAPRPQSPVFLSVAIPVEDASKKGSGSGDKRTPFTGGSYGIAGEITVTTAHLRRPDT
ncbi:calcium-binding tyrosine phosphorylation-regulated protein isoform X2 [Macrotis lagotis]